MRVWLIGADLSGTAALRQLRKNPNIDVVVTDTTDRPRAVQDRVIEKVDFVESVTSMNVNHLARRIRPDLILIDRSAIQRSIGRVSEGFAFADSIQSEIASASEFPCILL